MAKILCLTERQTLEPLCPNFTDGHEVVVITDIAGIESAFHQSHFDVMFLDEKINSTPPGAIITIVREYNSIIPIIAMTECLPRRKETLLKKGFTHVLALPIKDWGEIDQLINQWVEE